MTNPNVDGRHELLIVMAPVREGRAADVTTYLQGLETSPFARLPRTHVGRLIVLDDLPQDPGTEPDGLGQPYLMLTAVLDGDASSYLDELATEWADESPDWSPGWASQTWGLCVGCPDSPSAGELRSYLAHNRIDATYFFSAYRDASVEGVLSALEKRERLVAFAVAAQEIEPAARREAFLREFA
jgi:hypothetical protein